LPAGARGAQRCLLARAQFTGQFENAVAFRQPVAPVEFEQQVGGELSAAGADLDDLRRAERE